MNYDFGHYHDMDHDGDRDIKDSAMFHTMMEEDERKNCRVAATSSGTDGVSKKSVAILVGVLLVIYLIAELIFG